MSYYVHSIPGRLRIKSPGLRRNEAAAYEVRKALGTLNGVATIDINPVTGSLLVNYNPKTLGQEEILGLLERKGHFDRENSVTQDEYIQRATSKAGTFLGRTVIGASVEQALAGSPFALLALLI